MKIATIFKSLAALSAAFFIAGSALAQNTGPVTNHAFAIGKGPGVTGYTSLLCASAQLAVGQSAADPICKTITGDVTIDASGVTAIGASKVTNSQLATMAANTTKCNATAGAANPTDCTASTMRTNIGVVIGTNVQAWDTDLDCLAALSTTGIVARTGAGTCAVRTFTAPAAGITVTNGDGAAGNPTLALANDLAALEGLSSTGIARRTGTDAWSVGTAVANSELSTATDGTIKSNISGGTATPSDNTITTVLDKIFGTTQGSVVYRNASAWVALTPGGSGQLLSSGGAAANPSWITASGTGTVTSVICGTGLSGGTITASGTCAVDYATKSEQQTATSAVKTVNPARQQDHDSAAKAWMYFTQSGTTVTVQASYNVTSVVRNSTGLFTITFTTAFATSNFSCFGQAESATLNMSATAVPAGRSTTTYQMATINSLTGAVADPGGGQLVCFGRQ